MAQKEVILNAEKTRHLLLDLSVEFFDAARSPTETIQEARRLESIRYRSALRLVPKPKLGFEHLHHEELTKLIRDSVQTDLP